MQHHDIVFAGDFREPAFRTTTIADQTRTLSSKGFNVGLLQLSGESAGRPARIHEDFRNLIDADRVVHMDPDEPCSSRLLIVTDTSLFVHGPRRALAIDAATRVILVSTGPITRSGHHAYDWTSVHRDAVGMLGANVRWAPANPIIRGQLEQLDPKPNLTDIDWYGCIDRHDWNTERTGPPPPRPIVGRSGGQGTNFWPNMPTEISCLYPDDPQFPVRLLNGGPALRRVIGHYPRNWEILSSNDVNERDFLSSVDFFIYSQHSDSVGSIDASLLRAMASGIVAVLHPSFEPIFKDGAAYAEPHEVKSKVWALHTDRNAYLAITEAAARVLEETFSPQSLLKRVDALIDVSPSPRSAIPSGQKLTPCVGRKRNRRRVMFITINGIGMGHLTRMLAIAKRCPAPIEPVFVTMSQALKVLREQGYLAEFIPSRQYLDCDVNQWNGFLRDELNEMISFYDPTVVVFDGNVPYQGLIDVINANPDPWFIWSRRGMWRADNIDIISREKYFDVVLEPGDLAAADDHGITSRHRDRTYHVRPIRLLDASDMLSRDAARAELGLPLDKPAVLIQLGAGNNFDYRSIHKTALAHIEDRYDAGIAVGEWLIKDKPSDLPDHVARMPGYPFAKYFNAFDFAISAVGYNSFHELLLSGVPTILVPNEAMEQDNQLGRALYADRHGIAVCVRSKDIYRLTAAIDRMFQQEERERLKSRLNDLGSTNGAAEAASLIDEMAYSRRVDRP